MISKDGLFSGGGDQSLFITRKAFDLLGGFDESKVIMEDFDFFDRMKKQGIPYKFVQNDSIVSSRKYQKNSYLRVNLVNGITFLLYKLGASPVKLKKIYKSLLK